MMDNKKIFVSAYACEPGEGSEIGVGWHWVLEMSKYYELWVLTRAANKSTIEGWEREHRQLENIHFLYCDLPRFLAFWKKGLRGVRTYYCLWQKVTDKIVKATMEQNEISIYHLLTYGNALWPASKYGMSQKFIWGPVGGTDTVPTEYTKHYDARAKMIEAVRRWVVRTLPINRGYNKRCKNADIILCKTNATYENIPEKYRKKACVFTDVAIESNKTDAATENNAEDADNNIEAAEKCYADGMAKNDAENAEENGINTPDKGKNRRVKCLAVGHLDAWRGFDILIEAVAKCCRDNDGSKEDGRSGNDENSKNNECRQIELEILGEGKDRTRLKKIIEENHLESSVKLSGKVPMKEYEYKIKNADVIINPTLREGGVTVAFDSMREGKSLICVDTGGYTKKAKSGGALVLKRRGRDELIREMAEAIKQMTDEEKRREAGDKARESAMKNTWEEKGKEIKELLETEL